MVICIFMNFVYNRGLGGVDMVLSCSNIQKSFGSEEILKGITFKIEANEKLAIVGVNGAGKSTLMRILTGEESYDSGDIFMSKDTQIGYLSQETTLDLNATVYDSLLDEFRDVIALEERMRELEAIMATDHSVLDEYDHISHQFSEMDGYSYPSRIKGVLTGFGFGEEDYSSLIGALSGGQKTRISLAKLLLRSPDILCLDEPTNHLDAKAIEWLENYLKTYKKAVIVISHDRYFIDQFCNGILEIEHGKSKMYHGNYTFYVSTRDHDKEIEMKHYLNQQRIIKQQQDSIDKLKSFNREKSIKRAESKEKQLEKMVKIEEPEAEEGTIRLAFNPEFESGFDVLHCKGLTFGYGSPLFDSLDLDIKRGDRVALIGENGIGKTTLFKLILGELIPQKGTIRYGTHVTTAYYDQEHTSLNPYKTIFSEIQDEYPDMNNTQVRNLLASFQFRNEDVFKEISMLSGGEKGRVVLAKLLLTNANLLILDEPTNHLDIASKEILEDALIHFTGTVLFISHDRYFINKVATRIVEFTPHSLINFDGNYDHYLSVIHEKKEVEKKVPLTYLEQKARTQNLRKLQNNVKKLEDEISKLEAKMEKLQKEQMSEEVLNDYIRYNEIGGQISDIELELMDLMEAWESANNELEEAQAE